jgi:hypothetical protein
VNHHALGLVAFRTFPKRHRGVRLHLRVYMKRRGESVVVLHLGGSKAAVEISDLAVGLLEVVVGWFFSLVKVLFQVVLTVMLCVLDLHQTGR